MRRRKLMIGLGALTAGGSAAFGTEAFTSVEAERNVDVTIAGDQSAFVAIQPLSGANAGEYVATESDNTVEINLDGDSDGSGQGVSQDAITQIEDLFRIVNQGSQSSSIYFEDGSDAVTFRVTRSTNTSTTGSNGESLEGADNSVELDVGEQVVVGMTVDTLNNDVSGQLLDSVTLFADAGASAPEQSVPQPQYVVDGNGDEPNTFETISAAVDSVPQDAVVGVDGGQTIDESGSDVVVDTSNVTIAGYNGTPTIQTGRSRIQADSDGVTIRNLEITSNPGSDTFRTLEAVGSGVTFDGVKLSAPNSSGDLTEANGNPIIQVNGPDATVENCEVIGSAIGLKGVSGAAFTAVNNYIEDAATEGIFAFGNSSVDYTIENNKVENHNIDNVNAKEIKIAEDPASVNGETNKSAQIESLLTENSVNSVQLNGDAGTRATPDITGSGEQFASVNEVLKPGVKGGTAGGAGSDSALVALFESGEYDAFEDPVELTKQNAVIKGLGRPRLNYDGGYPNSSGGITFSAGGISVESIEVDFFGASTEINKSNFAGGESSLIDTGDSDVTFRNAALNVVLVEEDGSGTFDTEPSLGDTPGASYVNVNVGILNRQAGRPVSLDRGRPTQFFVIGQEIRDCTLRGGAKIATLGVTDPTIVDNRITDVASTESLAIDSGAASAVVRGNSIEYDDNDSRIVRPFDGAEIRMESGTPEVNDSDRGNAQGVADELSQANSGSQLASGNAVVVNRSTDSNTRSP